MHMEYVNFKGSDTSINYHALRWKREAIISKIQKSHKCAINYHSVFTLQGAIICFLSPCDSTFTFLQWFSCFFNSGINIMFWVFHVLGEMRFFILRARVCIHFTNNMPYLSKERHNSEFFHLLGERRFSTSSDTNLKEYREKINRSY